MGWNGVSPPYLILGLLIGLCLVTTLHAQTNSDACTLGGNIGIKFPESTTANPPPDIQIISSQPEAYGIQINQDSPDLNPEYKFADYFSFRYNPVQGNHYIVMIKGVDRDGLTSGIGDDVNILQYKFTCTPPGGSPIYSVLKIQIADVNDNPPIFTLPYYNTSTSELIPVGLIFYRDIAAFDLDEADNRQILYSLSDITGARFPGVNDFNIAVQGEGLVAVNRPLDFERMYRAAGNRADLCYYNMTVTATDGGVPPLSATTSFIILIVDDDDQGPQFIYPSCIPSIEQYGQSCIRAKYLSNLQPGSSQTLVFTPYPADTNNPEGNVEIIAQDRDTLNSAITFQIAQTLPFGFEQYFSVAAVQIGQTKQYRCVVTYSRVNDVPLNPKNVSSVEIIIQATENTFNRRQETATILVTLT